MRFVTSSRPWNALPPHLPIWAWAELALTLTSQPYENIPNNLESIVNLLHLRDTNIKIDNAVSRSHKLHTIKLKVSSVLATANRSPPPPPPPAFRPHFLQILVQALRLGPSHLLASPYPHRTAWASSEPWTHHLLDTVARRLRGTPGLRNHKCTVRLISFPHLLPLTLSSNRSQSDPFLAAQQLPHSS